MILYISSFPTIYPPPTPVISALKRIKAAKATPANALVSSNPGVKIIISSPSAFQFNVASPETSINVPGDTLVFFFKLLPSSLSVISSVPLPSRMYLVSGLSEEDVSDQEFFLDCCGHSRMPMLDASSEDGVVILISAICSFFVFEWVGYIGRGGEKMAMGAFCGLITKHDACETVKKNKVSDEECFILLSFLLLFSLCV
mmetsp:Transcript_17273/g.23789  ORF Transcript_17273/g.23789 Transcript_17273/m.23789 type:complete len:200 (-) Transcript_17273:112-711(-)